MASSSREEGKPTAPSTTRGAALSSTTSCRSHLPSILSAPINTLFPQSSEEVKPKAQNRAAWRARKLLLRALLVLVACFILILEPVTLSFLGNASFFAAIVSIMLPPTMPTMLFVLAMSTLVVGMCLGWAWSCAGMAASLLARDQVLLASQLQRVQSSLAGATNPDVLYQTRIFEGAFLDVRSTVVFGIFLAIGTFFLGLLRATTPKLTLLAMFGTITLDVMCSYGPLFPFAQYTLATSFLLPTACFVGIAMGANFLIFPESLNSSWTTNLVDSFLTPTLKRSLLHSRLLATTPPSSDASSAWADLQVPFAATRVQLAGGLEGLLGSVGMMELEISFGRLSASDLGELSEALRELHSKAVGLGVFHSHVNEGPRRHQAEAHDDDEESKTFLKPATHRMTNIRREIKEAEARHSHDLPSLLPVLESSSAPLRTAADKALAGAIAWSWTDSSIEESYQAQKLRVEALAHALDKYRSTGRQELCGPYADFFDPVSGALLPSSTGTILNFSPASLFLCFAASYNLVCYAQAFLAFLRQVNELEDKRRRMKVWFPSGARKLGNLLKGGKGVGRAAGDGQNPDRIDSVGDDEEDDAEQGGGGRDPDASLPRNGRQRFTLKLYRFGAWFSTAEAVFALKYAALTILLWLPQVIPASAFFTYVEKGLWALIAAQTTLTIYAGDQLSQSLQKMIGTALGLLYGMVIWYVGAGTGSGNRIGLGFSVAVLMLPVLAIRLYGPPQSMQTSIMFSVTVILVVGYSWSNANIFQVGSPGVGVELAWRRALLVIIGTVAATLVMLFPSPQSSRLLVRRTHATCIDEVGRIYSAIIGAWLAEDRLDTSSALSSSDSKRDVSPFSLLAQKKARARMLALYVKLGEIRLSIEQAGFEISMRGDWPQKTYNKLLETQLRVLEALAQLGGALVRLDPEWRRLLVRKTAFLNPNLISDVTCTFFLISMALREGSPLPESTPGPLLDRLLYHDEKRRKDAQVSAAEASDPDGEAKVEGAGMGNALTFELLKDEQFGIHATAVLALASILANLDELEKLTKQLVGEVRFSGHDALRACRGGAGLSV